MGYWMFLGLLLVCSVFSGWASMKVHSAYSAFSVEKNASRMTGYDTAVRLLRANGVSDVSVGRVKGRLTDHFDLRRQRGQPLRRDLRGRFGCRRGRGRARDRARHAEGKGVYSL
ncbi:MAG: zinc metallopeptidase [Christensenellaceae bacterium]